MCERSFSVVPRFGELSKAILIRDCGDVATCAPRSFDDLIKGREHMFLDGTKMMISISGWNRICKYILQFASICGFSGNARISLSGVVLLSELDLQGTTESQDDVLDFLCALLSPYEKNVRYNRRGSDLSTFKIASEIISAQNMKLFISGGQVFGVIIGSDGKCDDAMKLIKTNEKFKVWAAGMMVDKTMITMNRCDLFVLQCTHSRYTSEIQLNAPFNVKLSVSGSMIENFRRLSSIYRTAAYKRSTNKLGDVLFCQSYGVLARPFPSGVRSVPHFFKGVIDDIFVKVIRKVKGIVLYDCLIDKIGPKTNVNDLGFFLTEYCRAYGRHHGLWADCGTCSYNKNRQGEFSSLYRELVPIFGSMKASTSDPVVSNSMPPMELTTKSKSSIVSSTPMETNFFSDMQFTAIRNSKSLTSTPLLSSPTVPIGSASGSASANDGVFGLSSASNINSNASAAGALFSTGLNSSFKGSNSNV